jgi:hypothetical protein
MASVAETAEQRAFADLLAGDARAVKTGSGRMKNGAYPFADYWKVCYSVLHYAALATRSYVVKSEFVLVLPCVVLSPRLSPHTALDESPSQDGRRETSGTFSGMLHSGRPNW